MHQRQEEVQMFFIPLECCDDLMGARIRKSAFWEKSMSSTLKMFLIIEQKETASGMQIRMAHPALAEAVLSQILENNKETLSSLTLRFLDSANITSNFHSSLTVQIIICEAVKSIDQTDNISWNVLCFATI